MYSFTEVAKKVFYRSQREDFCKTFDFNADVRKKYKGYFIEIAKALLIEDHLCKLQVEKKENNYLFTEKATECLVELLFLYEKSKKNDGKKYITKKVSKQLFQSGQYNVFMSADLLKLLDELVDGNNLVLKAIECFYILFEEKGLDESEIQEILSNAERRYSYSKMKGYQEIFDILNRYIHSLERINQERHDIVGLTERENAIWLRYANDKIRQEMENVICVRERMQEIVRDETMDNLLEDFYKMKNEEISKCKEIENEILGRCGLNSEIREILNDYKYITGKEIKIEEVVPLVLVNEHMEDDLLDLTMREVLRVPVDGNVSWTKYDYEKIKELLFELYENVRKECDSYIWNLKLQERNEKRKRDYILLEAAIEELHDDSKTLQYEKLKDRKLNLNGIISSEE